jgi:hypothetical protein
MEEREKMREKRKPR